MTFVAGHRGMVGSAVVRRLQEKEELILRTREELDLRDPHAVDRFFQQQRPKKVILCAARVGGIVANANDCAGFLRDNLLIQTHVIDAAVKYGVEYFCFLGSSCIYPKEAAQPIKEEALLSGPLEPTNEGYALAKISGLKLLQYYCQQGAIEGISLMPCNLYGPNDNYHPENSHVLAALIRKFTEGASRVELWGTGAPRREFLHVDDLARAVDHFMTVRPSDPWINIGWGKDISIAELATLIAEKAGFEGEIAWDKTRPDGTLLKCLDVSRMVELGFTPSIDLSEGIERTVQSYKEQHLLSSRG